MMFNNSKIRPAIQAVLDLLEMPQEEWTQWTYSLHHEKRDIRITTGPKPAIDRLYLNKDEIKAFRAAYRRRLEKLLWKKCQ